MNDDLLDPSFLISNLAAHLAGSGNVRLMEAVDMFRRYQKASLPVDSSAYQFRWCSTLQSEGKLQEIKIVQKSMRILGTSLNSPNAMFQLLDKLRTQSPVPSEYAVSKMMPNKPASLPRDFLFVLQGLDGDNFRFSTARRCFVLKESISPSLQESAKQVSQVGCTVRLLNEFVAVKEGIARQRVSDHVRTVLKTHFDFVASMSQCFDRLSVPQFTALMMSREMRDLKATGIVCHTVASAHGGALFNMLNSISVHGDEFIARAGDNMKKACFSYIMESIRDWISKGEVDDPFSEFFVSKRESVIPCSKWWKEMYALVKDHTPNTITDEQATRIFSAGKALNFLRQWDSPVILDIPEGDFDEYVFNVSTKAHQTMLEFVNRDGALIKAVKDIHDFVLLQRGDFASVFCELSQESLPRKLERILQRFSDHAIKEIDIEVSENHCQFVYSAIPPLSAVFGPSEMMAYKLVSRTLIHLKTVEVALTKAGLATENRSFGILTFEMLTFVRLVQDFLNVHILTKSYSRLRNVFQEARNFDEILKAHTTHISNMTRGCWITESGRDCRLALVHTLETIQASIRTPGDLAEKQRNFRDALSRFHDAVAAHKASGCELSRPLIRAFRSLDNKSIDGKRR